MLEQKIEALTATIERLIATMGQAGSVAAPATAYPTHAEAAAAQAAPVVAAPVSFTPPPAPAAGMPGGPFTAAAPVAAPAPSFAPAAPGAPFSDLAGVTKYAMDAYGVLEPKGKGEVITQVITHLCGSTSINDLPAAKYGEFYQIIEQQKAA